TVTLGFGRDWLDLALQWTTVQERTVSFDAPTNAADTEVTGTFSGETFRLTFTVKKKPPLGKKQL
ncbi:MAG: hypothetical protein MI919_22815, partial [Holophagales bacterium]|nr:hypothetical protein [Holophagales bacterium]